MNKKLLIHAWAIEKKDQKYYLPFSHWIYLKEIVKYYDEVILLSSCFKLDGMLISENIDISSLKNVSVYELPAARGYVGAIKYFFSYFLAYRSLQGVTTYYSRFPTPFGWLQKVFGKNKRRIIHYVGNPADVTRNNPNFSFLKKIILLSGFSLEVFLYRWACKGAQVYTNGPHLAKELQKKGIEAKSLTSSTLSEEDFYYPSKSINPEDVVFIYLGYLRTAKGVETIIKAFSLYNEKYPNSKLQIIGSGEFENSLKDMVDYNNINNVDFLGRIENRSIINTKLRAADVFLFASVSEGSPRVILEAMANGLAIISTPVGSLPHFFEDDNDIVFADFNNHQDFYQKMMDLASDSAKYENIRSAAFNKIQKMTISNFIKSIFDS